MIEVETNDGSAKAVILLGGPSKGATFRPLSLTVPKPLFPVAGKPLLFHQIALLVQSKLVSEIILLGFFDQDPFFSSFINETSEHFKIRIKYLREYENLGTAGGLYHFRDQILRGNPKSIFVLHSDVVACFSIADMLSFHSEKSSLFTMLVSDQVPKGKFSEFGQVVLNKECGSIEHFVEKPSSFISNFINCGVYLIDSIVFDHLAQAAKNNEKSENPDCLMMEFDVIPFIQKKEKIYGYSKANFWKQIKTPSSVIEASGMLIDATCAETNGKNLKLFRLSEPCFIHPTATIHPTAELGPNVSISEKCNIGPGVRIKNSIILPGCTVKDNTLLLNSIIGWNSVVGKWCRIEGSLDEPETVTMNGIKTSSVSILSGDNTVANEVILRNCIVLPHKELNNDFHNEIIM